MRTAGVRFGTSISSVFVRTVPTIAMAACDGASEKAATSLMPTPTFDPSTLLAGAISMPVYIEEMTDDSETEWAHRKRGGRPITHDRREAEDRAILLRTVL